MLKKLTSPKAKAARSGGAKQTADKELSGLAAIPDDGDPKDKADGGSASTAAAAPNRKTESKTSKQRDQLSLDMNALAQSVAFDETAQEAEDHTWTGTASMDRRKTLARSPRVKNILKDPDEAGNDGGKEAKSTPQGKSSRPFDVTRDAKLKSSAKQAAAKKPPPSVSPAKDDKKNKTPTKNEELRGLKALKFSKTKMEAGDGSGDKQVPTRESTGTEDKAKPPLPGSGESNSKDRKKPKGKSEPKSHDQQDEETTAHEKSRGDPQPRSNQKIKSSLSPLRRRMPASETNNQLDAGRSKDHLLGHRLKVRDLPPANQPEVHIVGEITSGEGFGSGGFACKWGVEYGSLWHHIAGDELGQTQIDYTASSSHLIVWSHPVDLHFATTSFQGWPKLLLQVWQVDTHMKANVVGYGFINFPFSSGEHHLSVSLWRPMGSAKEEMEAKLLGRTPELASEDVVFNSAWADRCRLQTIATGKVNLQVGVILRNFQVSDMKM